MGAMKPWHWIVVLVIVLILFGAKRLPDLAKSVGQSMKIFKKEIKELTDDDTPTQTPVAEPPRAAGPATPTTPPASTTGEGSTPPQG